MFQNTEKHNKFVYASLKTSQKSPVFIVFSHALLLPNKNSAEQKPIVLHIEFAWISLFLTFSSYRKSPVFEEGKLFLYVSTEFF